MANKSENKGHRFAKKGERKKLILEFERTQVLPTACKNPFLDELLYHDSSRLLFKQPRHCLGWPANRQEHNRHLVYLNRASQLVNSPSTWNRGSVVPTVDAAVCCKALARPDSSNKCISRIFSDKTASDRCAITDCS